MCLINTAAPRSLILDLDCTRPSTSIVHNSASTHRTELSFGEGILLEVLYQPSKAHPDPPCHSRDIRRAVSHVKDIECHEGKVLIWQNLHWLAQRRIKFQPSEPWVHVTSSRLFNSFEVSGAYGMCVPGNAQITACF